MTTTTYLKKYEIDYSLTTQGQHQDTHTQTHKFLQLYYTKITICEKWKQKRIHKIRND